MAYRIKLHLDTSIDTQDSSDILLTSKMLRYETPTKRKLALEEYPMFSPYVTYPKERILNMKHYQRIELFFNKARFKRVIMSSWNGKKDSNSEQQHKREQNNLDIFIKAIMPTAYPIVNNYTKSYNYFENDKLFDFTTKGVGSSLPFIPGRFRKEFSHLKMGENIYTITGVVLKNDIFNHPIYSKLIREYANIENSDSVQSTNLEEEEKDFYLKEFYKTDSGKTLWQYLEGEVTTAKLNNYNATIAGRVINDDITTLKTFYQALLDLVDKRDSTFKKEDFPGNKNAIENKLNILYDSVKAIDKINTIGGVTNNQQTRLRSILREFGKLWIKKKARKYIQDQEFDFSSEGSREKDIRDYVEKLNPSFKKFSDMLSQLQKDRYIQNIEMREAIQKRKTDIFKSLLACRNNNSSCTEMVNKNLIRVGLDRVKEKENFTTIDLYLMINVIEGDLNKDNYKKVKCSYLDKSLGSIFESFFYPSQTWDISTRKVFFSIKKEVEKVDKEEKERKSVETRKKSRLSNVKEKKTTTRKQREDPKKK